LEKVFALYFKAAELGSGQVFLLSCNGCFTFLCCSVEGMFNLSECFALGQGVEQDGAKAELWQNKCFDGTILEQHSEDKTSFLQPSISKLAAIFLSTQKVVFCLFGSLHFNANIVAKQLDKAEALLCLLCESPYEMAEAMYQLALLRPNLPTVNAEEAKRKFSSVEQLFERAAELGHGQAMMRTAQLVLGKVAKTINVIDVIDVI
jgi:TPR repeat protein